MSSHNETTRDGLQEQIRDLQQQLAEQQERQHEVEQFANVAAHDLKEPLRIVASYLGLLKRRYGKDLPEGAASYVESALDVAAGMRHLIDSLLEFSRAQSVVFEDADLNACVQQAVASLGEVIAETQASVDVGELPRIQGDPAQLARVFQNLIANALKYRSERVPEIRVTSVIDGDCVRIAVADNGRGIAPEYQSRIFEMFTRLEARDGVDGSGIGLASCRRIVERHGGHIEVESELGQGSTFTVVLPREAQARSD